MQTSTHDVVMGPAEVSKRFVSYADGEAEREWDCLNLLWRHAPGIAPRPLRREVSDGHPVVVMSRIAGEPLRRGPLTDLQTKSLGQTLRALYDIPLESVVAAGISERRGGFAALTQDLPMWLSSAYELDLCREPALVDEAIRAAGAWMERAYALPEPHLTSFGIADLNPANVLWDGETCRLVDFEDGGITDPAYELADHVEHIAGRLAGTFDVDGLADAANLRRDQRERTQAYRPLWAAFWLVMLMPGNGGFHRNPPGSTETQARHLLNLIH